MEALAWHLPPQLLAPVITLRGTDWASGRNCVPLCFQDRKHESCKAPKKENKFCHQDKQEGRCGLKSSLKPAETLCRAPRWLPPGSLDTRGGRVSVRVSALCHSGTVARMSVRNEGCRPWSPRSLEVITMLSNLHYPFTVLVAIKF